MTRSQYLQDHADRHLNELFEFLRIPSVSTDPKHSSDVRLAANFLRDHFDNLGFEASVEETQGHPLVFAEYKVDESLPTLLIYGHYDVQPADPLTLWETDPFEPIVKDDCIVARGASDDKGQVFAHIKGVEALLRFQERLPLNVKFLIEGEEEIGSVNLDAFIENHKEMLAADIVLISDGAMIAPGIPTITYGLKGLSYLEVRLKAANMDLHSGAFGGGVPNVIHELAKMIAQLKDDSGRILVPGFYDDVLMIDEAEKLALSKVPFDEAEFAREIGVKATPGEQGYSLLERLWTRPTLDVNGIAGGFQGEGAKTVIAAEAMAKISCRLVANQDPIDIRNKLAEYLKSLAPAHVDIEIIDLHGGFPALTPIQAPVIQAAAKALEGVFGKETIFARTGGSIPVVHTFQEHVSQNVVLVGLGLESDRIHSPNEKFDLINYTRGIEVSAALLEAFAEMPVR